MFDHVGGAEYGGRKVKNRIICFVLYSVKAMQLQLCQMVIGNIAMEKRGAITFQDQILNAEKGGL